MDFIKKFWIIWAVLAVVIVAVAYLYTMSFAVPMNWGVTFSSVYARDELGLDWKRAYIAILDDLKADRIRLSAYWNEIEAVKGKYDFTDLDWQISEAEKRKAKVILAVGRRLPRWPECHDPLWLKEANAVEAEQRQLEFVKAVAGRYAGSKSIEYFQVENEPYLSTFGICPELNPDLFQDEIKAVKEITGKPILVTDSGELSTWLPISKSGGDILGTTLYRVVYNQYIGYFRWFTPPFYYWIRVKMLNQLTPMKKVIVAELQAEAWHRAGENLAMLTIAQSDQSMSIDQFRENIKFTRRAGFDEAYLWGVEWWYMMKTKNDYPAYWDEAKKLWQ